MFWAKDFPYPARIHKTHITAKDPLSRFFWTRAWKISTCLHGDLVISGLNLKSLNICTTDSFKNVWGGQLYHLLRFQIGSSSPSWCFPFSGSGTQQHWATSKDTQHSLQEGFRWAFQPPAFSRFVKSSPVGFVIMNTETWLSPFIHSFVHSFIHSILQRAHRDTYQRVNPITNILKCLKSLSSFSCIWKTSLSSHCSPRDPAWSAPCLALSHFASPSLSLSFCPPVLLPFTEGAKLRQLQGLYSAQHALLYLFHDWLSSNTSIPPRLFLSTRLKVILPSPVPGTGPNT